MLEKPLTTGIFFSGIGGDALGFEWEGFEIVFFCENDEYCQKILRKQWPGRPIYDDIATVDGAKLPYVDIHTLGFPCQDVSTAGKREGLKEGNRSGMWYKYARILGEMVRKGNNPRWVVVENVAGLISSGGLDIVLADLERLGYQALQPVLLEAASVGAPHKRERVFIVAWNAKSITITEKRGVHKGKSIESSRVCSDVANSLDSGKKAIRQENRKTGDNESSRPCEVHADVDNTKEFGLEIQQRQSRVLEKTKGERNNKSPCKGWWQTEPCVGRVAHGVPNRVDKLKALGNAIVPQCAQVIARAIKFMEASL